MAYFQTASAAGTDALLTIFSQQLTGQGWSEYAMNTSSVAPSTNYIGRQSVFRINGLTASPSKCFVGIYKHYEGNGSQAPRIGFVAFTGVRGFDAPQISGTITRVGTAMTFSSSVAHGLSAGDHVMIVDSNSTTGTSINEGWTAGDAPSLGTSPFSIAITNANVFTYTSQFATGTNSAPNTVKALACYNFASEYNTGFNSGLNLTLNEAAMAVFLYVDAFRCVGLINQGVQFAPFYFGETNRDHIPLEFQDRAFITSSIGPGTVTASLDRNSPNIATGQKIWFIHPSGNAGAGVFERTTIISKLNNTQFTCTLANGYVSGTIVGEDPLPVAVGGLNTGTSTANGQLTARTFRFCFHIDGTRTGTGNSGNTSHTMTLITDTGITQTNVNPDGANYYQGRDLFFQRATVPKGIRGRIVGWVGFPLGVQNNQDLMRVGAIAVTDDYKVFSSQLTDNANALLGIGPGAS